MSDIKVASRYAKALIELAVEKKQLEEVYRDVNQLLSVAAENRELVLLLNSPIVNTDKKHNVLKALFDKTGNAITLSFFEIITRKNRANVLVSTAREFKKLYNLHMGIQEAEVITTLPLTDDLRKRFEEIVKEISGLNKVVLIEKIDKDLIGGFVLKVNDKLLDDSLSGKLRNLRLKFAQRYFVKTY
ncbi:ATP synthase F1 subunit delta [Cecembia lonarensis]|uniref:ATP synthase subunit delta n=1 Tax=Cecembia lonarensis (strain CCUG 58316 / KCTC 22772 / LW9) TaxID=1225176 RepID=K1LDG6_CECL9|nr:ATP synthase F1 subunit delta [Cecembia lonarensis]EKB48413.1 F-type ATPase subunit delta [Cecembia lonarensis LW9]